MLISDSQPDNLPKMCHRHSFMQVKVVFRLCCEHKCVGQYELLLHGESRTMSSLGSGTLWVPKQHSPDSQGIKEQKLKKTKNSKTDDVLANRAKAMLTWSTVCLRWQAHFSSYCDTKHLKQSCCRHWVSMGKCSRNSIRLEVIAIRLEAMAIRLEAIAYYVGGHLCHLY